VSRRLKLFVFLLILPKVCLCSDMRLESPFAGTELSGKFRRETDLTKKLSQGEPKTNISSLQVCLISHIHLDAPLRMVGNATFDNNRPKINNLQFTSI